MVIGKDLATEISENPKDPSNPINKSDIQAFQNVDVANNDAYNFSFGYDATNQKITYTYGGATADIDEKTATIKTLIIPIDELAPDEIIISGPDSPPLALVISASTRTAKNTQKIIFDSIYFGPSTELTVNYLDSENKDKDGNPIVLLEHQNIMAQV